MASRLYCRQALWDHPDWPLLPPAIRLSQVISHQVPVTNSFICHTSEKLPPKSNHCHTSKNTPPQILCLPHLRPPPFIPGRGEGPFVSSASPLSLTIAIRHFIPFVFKGFRTLCIQRSTRNPFLINCFRTLCRSTGVCPCTDFSPRENPHNKKRRNPCLPEKVTLT